MIKHTLSCGINKYFLKEHYMKRAKIFALAVLSTVLLIMDLGSCTNKEEELYGKILAKDKSEVELIQKIQNARFEINKNVTLKEAIAANAYSKNIEWDIIPLEDLGTYLVSFQYDLDPIESAMNMDFFDGDDELILEIFFAFDALHGGGYLSRDLREYNHGDILSPIGYANIFSRFIFGEILIPNGEGTAEEMKAALDAYEEYQKEYEGISVFIPLDRVPETLPEPFFVPTAGKFIGYCYAELASDDTEFVAFKLLFDVRLPYMDNKEYKGIGMTSTDADNFYSVNSHNRIEAIQGLEMVYRSYPVGKLFPYANSPLRGWLARGLGY
jgi:hypothetical protein